MDMKKILFILFISILILLPIVNAIDSETIISCGGDDELIIGCFGDQQNFFSGKISIGKIVSGELGGGGGGGLQEEEKKISFIEKIFGVNYLYIITAIMLFFGFFLLIIILKKKKEEK